MEETAPEIDVQELIDLYERRIQDQSGIMFALIGKLGGKVTLTKDDLLAFPEFNTVSAIPDGDDALLLELVYEDR
jgi:hypothetical protein